MSYAAPLRTPVPVDRAANGVALTPRDPASRRRYLEMALAAIPRLLGAIDRNLYRATYGCFDRQFWHYRTSSFPSEMYQEAVLPLALVYATDLPGNRWHGDARVRELAVAALRFSARSCHADGSCDDYYPFERALGAAVFSLQAAAQAYERLELDDAEIRMWLARRARWISTHDESGVLTNHHALAALGLLHTAEITGHTEFHEAAWKHIRRVLRWQSSEGWFEEYGGADPGYQTVTIDCLAKIRRLTGAVELDEPLTRAVDFARRFLHPDASYGGEYGSRGTYHFYPHGCELLAAENADAADLADGFLHSLSRGTQATFDDDRMVAHRLANLIEAYVDWAPARPAAEPITREPRAEYLREAGLLVCRTGDTHTIAAAHRGGVFKHFPAHDERPVTDAGLIVETDDGRVAVSQRFDKTRLVQEFLDPQHAAATLTVVGPLHWVRWETATPLKQAVFHVGLWMVGRWCRSLVRRVLQRRLITGRKTCPMQLVRTLQWQAGRLRVTDTIELTNSKTRVRRMSFGTDFEAAYVAAGGVYQSSVLHPWQHLDEHVATLNERRVVTIVREL